MATLKDILGAVLCDVIRAQHQTNEYSKMLSEQYQQGGKMQGMKLPSAQIGQLELSFKYAVIDGVEEQEVESVNNSGVRRALVYVVKESVPLLLKTFIREVHDSGIAYQEKYAFIDTLMENKEFIKHLNKRFITLLMEQLDELLDNEQKLDFDKVYKAIIDAADDQILEHDDIVPVMRLGGEVTMNQRMNNAFEASLRKELDDILRESTMASFRRIQRFGSMNVELNSEKLGMMDGSLVNTMVVKIGPDGVTFN